MTALLCEKHQSPKEQKTQPAPLCWLLEPPREGLAGYSGNELVQGAATIIHWEAFDIKYKFPREKA